MKRGTNRTTKKGWQPKAIAAVAGGASVTEAANAAGVGRRTLYRHLEENPEFREAFDDACEQGTDVLETEATARAVHGVDEPVMYQGRPTFIGFDKDGHPCEPNSPLCVRQDIFTIRKPSDTLMIFLLKARRPSKYREGKLSVEHSGAGGGPIVNKLVITVDQLADAYADVLRQQRGLAAADNN